MKNDQYFEIFDLAVLIILTALSFFLGKLALDYSGLFILAINGAICGTLLIGEEAFC